MSLLYKIADNIDEINHKPRLEKRQPDTYEQIGDVLNTKSDGVIVISALVIFWVFMVWLGYMAVMSGGI